MLPVDPMPDDRRSARRARLSGVRVTYEDAAGARHQADVFDLSRDGLFVSSAQPIAVGKRLSLEIVAAGEPAPWPALGRVVWVRTPGEGEGRPAGMAVKIIDIEDAVVAAMDRLIETRERTEPGLGEGRDERVRPPPPARERTVLGIGAGAAPAPPAAVAPVVMAAPAREATLLGVGLDSEAADAREPSEAIDLVTRKPPSTRPRPPSAPDLDWTPAPERASEPEPEPAHAHAPEPAHAHAPEPARASSRTSEPEPDDDARASEPSPDDDAPALPRRSSGLGWLFLVIVLAGGGVAGYAFRDRLLPLWRIAVETVMKKLR